MSIRINKVQLYIWTLLICGIVGITLFTICFNRVEQDEFATIVNSWTMQFRPNILSQGVYILHPGDNMIKFKRTLQSIEPGTLECLSKDEILLEINVATQFQYTQDKLIPIILEQFNTDKKYKIFLTSLIRSSILGSCLNFTALEYYEKRATVDAQMSANLGYNINDKDLGCTIEYFQLVDIVYPNDYIEILHEKQNVIQKLITAQNNRETELINANTDQMERKRLANVNLINANNHYNITLFNANTLKDATAIQWSSRSITYKTIMDDLNLTSDQMIDYLRSDVVRTSNLLSNI
jgi:hypothetical protein